MILEGIFKPLDVTQSDIARRLGRDLSVAEMKSFYDADQSRLILICDFRVTSVMSPDFWFGLQQRLGSWHALRSSEAEKSLRLEQIASSEQHVI